MGLSDGQVSYANIINADSKQGCIHSFNSIVHSDIGNNNNNSNTSKKDDDKNNDKCFE